jgi:nucleotide-binding universal stress UspA family protein
MSAVRHILHASDLSTASRRAFRAAADLAKSLDAKLTILYVLPPMLPAMPDQYIDAETLDRFDRQARQWGRGHLDRLARAAKQAGIRCATLLLDGDPVEEIVRTSRKNRADLIVLGTHGRRGLPKFFLGSVAERVVSRASCPVMTVRGS